MPEQGSSFQWSDFRGGEWSPFAQGRIDDPKYRTALNLSENGQPIEEGAWTRRSGRRRLGASAYGAEGVVRTFWLQDHRPAVLELTYSAAYGKSFMRFWVQQFAGMDSDDLVLLCDNYQKIINLSQDNPAIVTIAGTPPQSMNGNGSWSDGDNIQIFIDPSVPLANGPAWINRQFTIKRIDDTHYQLFDMETAEPIDGSANGLFVSEYGNSFAGHIAQFGMPYGSLDEVRRVRLVQTGINAYLFSKIRFPLLLSQVNPAPANAVTSSAAWFTLQNAQFVDGPYIDALPGGSQTGNSVAKLSQMDSAGVATFAVTDSAYFFQPGDVGRSIRVWCQPQPWLGGTYVGDTGNAPFPRVTFQGNFWGLAANTNLQPGLVGSGCNPLSQGGWYLEQDFGRWGYGVIKELLPGNPYGCRIQFQNPGGNGGGMDNGTIQGNSVTADGAVHTDAVIDTWQIGTYTLNQYPTCGTFYQGRLWLGGALPNRIDASMSDGGSVSGFLTIPNSQNPSFYPSAATQSNANLGGLSFLLATNPTFATTQVTSGPLGSTPIPGATLDTNRIFFSPTNGQGQVLDNHGIALVLNTPEQDEVNFLKPHNTGIVIGTVAGEHVIEAPENSNVLTPSSAAVRQISKYGAAFIEPILIGAALVFVQSYGRRIYEYLADFFSRRLIGRHLNEYAKHVTEAGIIETAYVEENTPVLHCVMSDGSLASCVYRRFSAFGTEAPTFYAWNRYVLPDDRKFFSVTTASDRDGTIDQLVMLSTDGNIPLLNPIQPVPIPPLPPPPPPPPNPTPPSLCCGPAGCFSGSCNTCTGGGRGCCGPTCGCGCTCAGCACGCGCGDGCGCGSAGGCASGCSGDASGCAGGCAGGCGGGSGSGDGGGDSGGC